MGIPFNPALTSNAAGLFGITSDGFVQGSFMDDPAVRYQLFNGVLGASETLPIWGGVGISVDTPAAGSDELGATVGRATNVTASAAGQLRGFTVFNQAIAWITSPQSPVPQGANGATVPYFLLGSNARIAVQCDPALVDLDGNSISQPVSWDYVNQQLIPYVAAYPANAITAASWASTGGGEVTFTTTTNHGVGVGDVFVISGMTPAGYNGTFTAITGTGTDSLVAALTTNPGSETGLGTLVAGGGALPCQVLSINPNGKIAQYNAATGALTWASGYTALIKI